MSRFKGTGRFAETSRWLCNPPVAKPCIVSGTMAEVLVYHPEFDLKFISHDEDMLTRWHARQHRKPEPCRLCEDVAAAYVEEPQEGADPPSLYMLRHKCGTLSYPVQHHRLKADEEGAKKGYRFQDLLMGVCQKCRVDVMGYVGTDHAGSPLVYEPIASERKIVQQWIDRIGQDVVKPKTGQLRPAGTKGPQDLGDSTKRMGTVTGCLQDKNSGKYRYMDVITVQ